MLILDPEIVESNHLRKKNCMNDSLSDAHLCPGHATVKNRAFSLTWPASMQFIGTKESVYIRQEFNSHRIV